MAKKKRRKKKPKRKSPKGSASKTNLIRAIAGFGVLIILVVIAGVYVHHILLKKSTTEHVVKPRIIKPPRFEVYPKEEIPPREPITKPRLSKKLPKIAIIIDDVVFYQYTPIDGIYCIERIELYSLTAARDCVIRNRDNNAIICVSVNANIAAIK